MMYNPDKKEIILDRELSLLDRFVIDFCRLLDNYVLVSGYVSILFGRSRSTEDVDLLVDELPFSEFQKLWVKIYDNGFECVTTNNLKEAYQSLQNHNIRFSRKGVAVPNMEFKQAKNDIDEYSLRNKIAVKIRNKTLFVSPIEMQIAYKLFLAADGTDEELISDKDIEDARHLYKVFLEKINKEELLVLMDKLNVKKRFRLLK